MTVVVKKEIVFISGFSEMITGEMADFISDDLAEKKINTKITEINFKK